MARKRPNVRVASNEEPYSMYRRSTRWYQFIPITQWPAGPVPVIISELATGVTDGKLETQSGTICPRSSSSPKVGA
jgi:hypothetical protein